jgi:hypothetical protein
MRPVQTPHIPDKNKPALKPVYSFQAACTASACRTTAANSSSKAATASRLASL